MHLSSTLAAALLAASASAYIPEEIYTRHILARSALADPDPGLGSAVKSAETKVKGEVDKGKDYLKQHAGGAAQKVQQGAQWYNQHADAVKQAGKDVSAFAKKHEEQLGGAVKFAEKHKGAFEKVGKVLEDGAGLVGKRDALAMAAALADAEAIADAEAEPSFKSFIKGAEHKIEGGAKKVGQFVEKHKSGIEKGLEVGAQVAPMLLGRDAEAWGEDEEALNLFYVRMAEAAPEASFGSFIKGAEHKIEGGAKKVGKFVKDHKSGIEKGLEVGAQVAPMLLGRDAEEEALNMFYVRMAEADPEASFGSFIKGAEHKIEGGAKKVGQFVEKHKSGIEKGLEVGAQVAPILLGREADEEALNWLYVRMAEADPEAEVYGEEWVLA